MTSNVPGAMRSAFRAYNTDGVPGSGAYNPDKGVISGVGATIGSELDTLTAAVAATNATVAALTAIGAGGMVGYATAAAMNADLAHVAGTLAEVSYATD